MAEHDPHQLEDELWLTARTTLRGLGLLVEESTDAPL
jgi:hypothetical protein